MVRTDKTKITVSLHWLSFPRLNFISSFLTLSPFPHSEQCRSSACHSTSQNHISATPSSSHFYCVLPWPFHRLQHHPRYIHLLHYSVLHGVQCGYWLWSGLLQAPGGWHSSVWSSPWAIGGISASVHGAHPATSFSSDLGCVELFPHTPLSASSCCPVLYDLFSKVPWVSLMSSALASSRSTGAACVQHGLASGFLSEMTPAACCYQNLAVQTQYRSKPLD